MCTVYDRLKSDQFYTIIMIRFYYKSNKKQALENISDYVRIEGGYWFAETLGSIHQTFSVRARFSIENTNIEYLFPIEDGFMQTPCWQDEPLQQGVLLRTEMDWTLFGLVQQKESELVQMVLSGPLQMPLPEWVKQELEIHSISEETLVTAIRIYEPRAFLDQAVLEQLEQQHPAPRVRSPLQTQQQTQSSNERSRADPRAASSSSELKPASKQHRQPESQVPAFAVPKSVQIGSLCPPVSLPAEQPPRKSPYRQKVHPPHREQVRAKVAQQCLIDPSLS
jgi:hypothetical protein